MIGYLVVSFLLLLAFVGFGAYVALQHNKDGTYCEYEAPSSESNYQYSDGERCRVRLSVLASTYGVLFLVFMLLSQGPVYIFLGLRRLWRGRLRARAGPGAPPASGQATSPSLIGDITIGAAVTAIAGGFAYYIAVIGRLESRPLWGLLAAAAMLAVIVSMIRSGAAAPQP